MPVSPKAQPRHLILIDPSSDRPEFGCANQIALLSPVPVTYHVPALYGMASLQQEQVASACGVIVLGSASSVNARTPWQSDLAAWLRPVMAAEVPTLGICFGHQFIASLFGARVASVGLGENCYRGLRQIAVEKTVWSEAQQGPVAVSHGEVVAEVPQSMRIFARRLAAGPGAGEHQVVEGLEHRHLPVWTMQSHPEADDLFIQHQGLASSDFTPATLAFGQALVQQFISYAVSRGHNHTQHTELGQSSAYVL